MEKRFIERFVGKNISFHKKGCPTHFYGKVLEISDTSIVLEFKGYTQVYNIEEITDMAEINISRKHELRFVDDKQVDNGW